LGENDSSAGNFALIDAKGNVKLRKLAQCGVDADLCLDGLAWEDRLLDLEVGNLGENEMSGSIIRKSGGP
jgi:hypothetical protein